MLDSKERRDYMKRQVYRFLTLVSLLLALSAVSVNAQSARVTMNIPFDFAVGQHTFAAGDYSVEPIRRDSRTIWKLQSKTGKESVLFITNFAWSNKDQKHNRLVFNRYGARYVLAQIWYAGENSGRQLRQPKWEMELTKNGVKPETVVMNVDQ